jgi:CheY-like chemotaxis protein
MPNKKIVVIDDVKEFVEHLTMVLEIEGYEVVPCLGSLRAYEVLKREKPDLIILDIMMPGRSGWEIIDILKSDSDLKDTPIIISTGVRTATARLAGTRYEILKKPFGNQDLIGKVKKLVGDP